jgi:hypothetical protein
MTGPLLRPDELVLLVLVVELAELVVVAPDCELPRLEFNPKAEVAPELEFAEPSPKPPLEEPKPEFDDPRPELEEPSPELEAPSPELVDPSPELEDPNPELDDPNPELDDPNPELEELELLELEMGFVELKVEVVPPRVEPVLVPESSAGSQPSPRGWRTGRGTSCVKSCVMRRMVVCTACRRSARASSASRLSSA